MRMVASRSRPNPRSTSLPSTTPASAALASPGEICPATSRTGVPAATLRLDPSGSVTVIWLIVETTWRLSLQLGPSTRALHSARSGAFSLSVARHERACRLAAGELTGESNGRHGWTRTTDLLRVKQAL